MKATRGNPYSRHRLAGFTLVEQIVVVAISIVCVTTMLMALGRTSSLRAREVAAQKAYASQRAVVREVESSITNAASKLAVFDAEETFRRGRQGFGGARERGSDFGSSRAPAPGGGAKPGLGEGIGDDAMHFTIREVERDPAFFFGPPCYLGDVPIGPVTIGADALVPGQRGKFISMLRVDPRTERFTMAADFVTTSGRLRLIAHVGEAAEAIVALGPGDLLLLTGRTPQPTTVSAFALVVGVPRPVEFEATVAMATRANFRQYDVPVDTDPGRTFPWDIRNPVETRQETHFTRGASVVKTLAPLTYYVTTDGGLYSVEGNPRAPASARVERVADDVGELRAWGVLADGAVRETVTAADARELRTIHVEIAIDGDLARSGEPRGISAEFPIWSNALQDRPVKAVVAWQGPLPGGTGDDGPPAGYCLVLAADPSSWPPGFDPRVRASWERVAWWGEADPRDPATWFWDCSGIGEGGGR
jgi:hypothetical protein